MELLDKIKELEDEIERYSKTGIILVKDYQDKCSECNKLKKENIKIGKENSSLKGEIDRLEKVVEAFKRR